MVPKNTRQQNRCCRSDVTTRKRGRFTENLSIYHSSPAPNSLLPNPSNFGATASHWLLYFLLFFFFLIFNRMDAWSLMRGDAFIHFVSGSRWVNIRLGVLLLIPKSPHWERYNPSYSFIYGLNSITDVIQQEYIWHWITHEGWYTIKQRNKI